MPSITLGQFIDNIEKNGVPHIVGMYLQRTTNSEKKRENIIGACALGQGALNTFADDEIFTVHEDFWQALQNTYSEPVEGGFSNYSFVNRIIHWNDTEKLSLGEIANRARETFAKNLDTVIEWKD
jgi:hypothetical protein